MRGKNDTFFCGDVQGCGERVRSGGFFFCGRLRTSARTSQYGTGFGTEGTARNGLRHGGGQYGTDSARRGSARNRRWYKVGQYGTDFGTVRVSTPSLPSNNDFASFFRGRPRFKVRKADLLPKLRAICGGSGTAGQQRSERSGDGDAVTALDDLAKELGVAGSRLETLDEILGC